MTVDVTSAKSRASDGSVSLALKLSSPDWELNVWLSATQAADLVAVDIPNWLAGSVRAGTSAGQPVHWSCDDDRVSMLVGHDDQTWDFGVSVSVPEFERALTSIREHVSN